MSSIVDRKDQETPIEEDGEFNRLKRGIKMIEKTEESPFRYITKASSSVEAKREIFMKIMAHESKSKELEKKTQIRSKKLVRFMLDQSPEKFLQESPSTSNQEIKIVDNSNTVCPECGRHFSSDKAMFGHTRIHGKKGLKGSSSKSPLNLKLKSKLDKRAELISNLRWAVTAKRGRKPLINPNTPEFIVASILLDMSRETLETNKKGHKGSSSKSPLNLKLKSRLDKRAELISNLRWAVTAKRGRKPLINPNTPEFIVASILLEMSRETLETNKRTLDRSEPSNEPQIMKRSRSDQTRSISLNVASEAQNPQITLDKKFVCDVCDRVFDTHQALGGHKSSHKKDKGILVISKSSEFRNGELQKVKMAKKGDHICEICGAGFPTGQALGGHKRRHYNRNENREMNSSRQMVSSERLMVA